MPNEKQSDDLTAAPQNPDEFARLFDYPSVEELFRTADTRLLDEFCDKLTVTREHLERVVRYGARDEAERAARAVKAIETTLEFLENLQKMRLGSSQ